MTEKQMIALLRTATKKTNSAARRKAAAKKLTKAMHAQDWSPYFTFRRTLADWWEKQMMQTAKTLRDKKMMLPKKKGEMP